MNKFLSNAIGKLNALIAWLLIIGAPLAGLFTGGAIGLIVGLAAGIVGAILLCGILALLIDIRDSLRRIAGVGDAGSPGNGG